MDGGARWDDGTDDCGERRGRKFMKFQRKGETRMLDCIIRFTFLTQHGVQAEDSKSDLRDGTFFALMVCNSKLWLVR